jgi:hypothetical protein
MARIKTKDLPVKEDLSDEEKKKIKGGIRFDDGLNLSGDGKSSLRRGNTTNIGLEQDGVTTKPK